jgi:hypothetical protein
MTLKLVFTLGKSIDMFCLRRNPRILVAGDDGVLRDVGDKNHPLFGVERVCHPRLLHKKLSNACR